MMTEIGPHRTHSAPAKFTIIWVRPEMDDPQLPIIWSDRVTRERNLLGRFCWRRSRPNESKTCGDQEAKYDTERKPVVPFHGKDPL
jgi:hypothetical protein